MACKYDFNGVSAPELDSMLNYIEETDPGSRTPLQLMEKFAESGMVEFDEGIGSYVTLSDAAEDSMKVINAINRMTVDVFRGGKPLFLTDSLGKLNRVRVDNSVLTRMTILPGDFNLLDSNDANSNALNNPNKDNEQGDEQSELEEENGDVRENADILTDRIITNLEYEIGRISRIPESDRTRKQIADLKVLQRNLRKVRDKHQKVSDYFDFVDYVATVAKAGNSLIARIEKDVDRVDQMSDKEKMQTLRDISELKESIDAFYNQDDKKSVLALLETKLLREGVVGTEAERTFLLAKLQEAVSSMRAVNNEYLDTAIPVLARTLHSFAPIEINEQLNSQIKNLKDNMEKGIFLTSGLSRLDKRFLKARTKGKKSSY